MVLFTNETNTKYGNIDKRYSTIHTAAKSYKKSVNPSHSNKLWMIVEKKSLCQSVVMVTIVKN